jgi:hypothetical protein
MHILFYSLWGCLQLMVFICEVTVFKSKFELETAIYQEILFQQALRILRLFKTKFIVCLLTPSLFAGILQSRPFMHDKRKYHILADPALQGSYPALAFNQLVSITIMCLQEQSHVRPIIADVAVGLSHVASQLYVPERHWASLGSPAHSGSPQFAATPSRRRGGRRAAQYSSSAR